MTIPDKAEPRITLDNDTEKFPHPGNEQLLTYFKNDQLGKKGAESQRAIDEYPLRAHPDLMDFFNHLPLAQGVKKAVLMAVRFWSMRQV